MATFIKRNKIHDYISYNSKYKTILNFSLIKKKVRFRLLFVATVLFFISPVFFYTSLFMLTALLWTQLFSEYFFNQKRFSKYMSILAPKTSRKVLSVVGYQVYPEELEEHLSVVKDSSDDGMDKLAAMQKKFISSNQEYRHVGLHKSLMTTHLILIGKSGSGKTEGVRSISDDVLKMGGCLLMNDGKSDENMYREFQSQANRAWRETSGYTLNFLKAEQMGESNTFSPITIMHPIKIVEFLGSLAGGGDSGGNADYFFKRGKAMLFPVTNTVYIRNKFFQEGFSVEMIFSNSSIQNYFFNTLVMMCMAKDISEMIKENSLLSSKISTVRKITIHTFLEEVEKSIEYVTQNPSQAYLFKQEIGIDFVDIKEIFSNCFVLKYSFITKIWNQYVPAINLTGRALYAVVKEKGQSFMGDGALKINDIRHYYIDLQDILKEEVSVVQDFCVDNNLEHYGIKGSDIKSLIEVFHKDKGGTAENPPADAVMQHSYAQQQWDTLEGIFSMYKHVFGQTKPEIKPEKLMKDNKFLYALLPPLELQADQTEILGKMLVMTIREIAAIALGGKELSIHKTLANIYKDIRRPKPFTFVILDEYGAYPVEGIDLLLAQLRSLDISVAISTQVYADLKAGGDNETSKEKVLGNTTKWILKSEDEGTIDWVSKMISEVKVEMPKLQKDVNGEWTQGADIDLQNEKSFNPEMIRNFANGFALLLLGNEEDDAVFVQSFYRGGEAKNVFVRRYDNIDKI